MRDQEEQLSELQQGILREIEALVAKGDLPILSTSVN